MPHGVVGWEFSEPWIACSRCSDLIESNRYRALARASQMMCAYDLHALFRRHRTGPRRRLPAISPDSSTPKGGDRPMMRLITRYCAHCNKATQHRSYPDGSMDCIICGTETPGAAERTSPPTGSTGGTPMTADPFKITPKQYTDDGATVTTRRRPKRSKNSTAASMRSPMRPRKAETTPTADVVTETEEAEREVRAETGASARRPQSVTSPGDRRSRDR